jgi:type VI protein secretion system component Hcp
MKVNGKQILESTVKEKTEHELKEKAELFGFYLTTSRAVNPNIGNLLFTSAMIKHGDCTIVIPNGGYVPSIELYMHCGQPFEEISISCYGVFANKIEEYLIVTFKDSYVNSVTQDGDRVFVRFRVAKKMHKFIEFNQNDAKKAGNSVCEFDFVANQTV